MRVAWSLLLLIGVCTAAGEAPQLNPADLEDIEQQLIAAVEAVTPATVSIRSGEGNGSGVVVSEDGLIYTVAHVAGQPGQRATVFIPDGTVALAETMAHDADADGGLLQLLGDGPWPFVDRRDIAPHAHAGLAPGDFVIALGHPSGFDVARPVVARLGRVVRVADDFIQTDAVLVAGDSGGPLVDLSGRVVGIHSRIGAAASDNYHVPIAQFRPDAPAPTGGNPDPLPPAQHTDGKAFLTAFLGTVEPLRESVAEVRRDGELVSFGTVFAVDAEATWVVGVAGELCDTRSPEDLKLTVGTEAFSEPATLAATDRATGLALLRIEGAHRGWNAVDWSQQDPTAGRWAVVPNVAVGVDGDVQDGTSPVLAVGIVSTPPRTVASRARLGVVFADASAGPLVRFVVPDSAANAAGVQTGDVLRAIDGQPTETPRAVVEALRGKLPGDPVRVSVRRGADTLQLAATLTDGPDRPSDRAGRMDRASGPMSARRSGFERVWSHDAQLLPNQCGGPVVTLDGQVVGINLARAGRVETLVLPATEVRAALERMRNAAARGDTAEQE